MLYDLYRKQKTSPQKAMEGQFLFGIYRLEEWKGLVEAFGFSPGTLVELDHMDQSRTLHKLDSYYGYCFGFVHPLKGSRSRYWFILPAKGSDSNQ